MRELSGTTVARAAAYFNQHTRLRLNDCFALALAEDINDSILLTGDGSLRTVAEHKGIETHGVLWVTDELEAHAIVPLRRLHDALCLFHNDDLVFLPTGEVRRRLNRLANLL